MNEPLITIDEKLKNILYCATVIAFDVQPLESHIALEQKLGELVESVKRNIPAEKLLRITHAREVRNMFKKVKVDPTKHRPSSEALFRRVHKEGFIPFINSVVAICNYCSLKYFIPMGCYDLDVIGASLTVRLGRDSDAFSSLKTIEYNPTGKIIIADDNGALGSPIIDSVRASVTLKTQNCAMVYFVPITVPEDSIVDSINLCSELLRTFALKKNGEGSIGVTT